MPVKKFSIGGFRGVLSPLPLEFTRGQSERSMIIYGRNGTGKSSITDGWEWFHSGKIEHLAKEGAGESSYPHREATQGETFVEINFSDSQIGTVRMTFDFSRVTMPQIQGNRELLRTLAPHPCHLRYADLTRFVYARKAEQYDSLARLMGFVPQVEIQKGLRRVQRRLIEESERARTSSQVGDNELQQHLGFDPRDADTFLRTVNTRLTRNALGSAGSLSDIAVRHAELRARVTSDHLAKELGHIQAALRILPLLTVNAQLQISLVAYHEQIVVLRGQEASYLKQLLIQLYEKGIEILSEKAKLGERTDHCPLCGRKFDNDLSHHIRTELSSLKQLKDRRDALERQRTLLTRLCPQDGYFSQSVSPLSETAKGVSVDFSATEIIETSGEIDTILSAVRPLLQLTPESLSGFQIDSIPSSASALVRSAANLSTLIAQSTSALIQRQSALSADTTRAQLIQDYEWIGTSLGLHSRASSLRRKSVALESISTTFASLIDSYSAACIADVQSRFAVISADVKRYFGILEDSTSGITDPSLKLLFDQDRAVILEIVFHNRVESPAYKYLSESQLNSFGLSVFLASAKSFNRHFRFLLLDDVVNSFDGHKRPRVIRLLHQEFSGYQFIVLTHDNVWWNQLMEHFPSWIRLHFQRIEYGSGPIVVPAKTELELIKHLIDEDQGVPAGRIMGPYLERKLQEICELFEAPVPFRRTNEYTLRELIQRFLSRVREKLTAASSLYRLVSTLDTDAGFRNFCSHWKNPAIQITTDEVREIVRLWEEILSVVSCSQPACNSLVTYDGDNQFVCSCGRTVLSRS